MECLVDKKKVILTILTAQKKMWLIKANPDKQNILGMKKSFKY
jgi:hypothetical protein